MMFSFSNIHYHPIDMHTNLLKVQVTRREIPADAQDRLPVI